MFSLQQKSLPLLRQSLFSREMTIEGIRPPPQQVVNTSSVAQVPQIQVRIQNFLFLLIWKIKQWVKKVRFILHSK